MFKKVFKLVIALEGGFVLHKNETEVAETYAGVYRAANPNWLGWTFLDNGETPPIDLVEEIYRVQYWDCIPLEDGPVKALIFEYGVNAGIGKAIKTAQIVAEVTADGNIGPKTKAALENIPFDIFLVKYSLERVKYYLSLANNKPQKYGIYLRGWLNRIFDSEEWFKSVTV